MALQPSLLGGFWLYIPKLYTTKRQEFVLTCIVGEGVILWIVINMKYCTKEKNNFCPIIKI